MNDITIRPAVKADVPAIFRLVEELAEFERLADEVETSAERYLRDGFGEKPWFHCLVAEETDGSLIGMALYYFGYSTWKGRMLYLEDFMVQATHRRQGIGRALISGLVAEGLKHDVQLMKWEVIDWNEGAKAMYRSLGGDLDSGWINVKLYRDQLESWTPA
jgi:GNAT superfamily N-acetyltransferase